jgi:hypothetical protein
LSLQKRIDSKENELLSSPFTSHKIPFIHDLSTTSSLLPDPIPSFSITRPEKIDIACQVHSLSLSSKKDAACQTEESWISSMDWIPYPLSHSVPIIIPYELLLKEVIRLNLDRLHLEVNYHAACCFFMEILKIDILELFK